MNTPVLRHISDDKTEQRKIKKEEHQKRLESIKQTNEQIFNMLFVEDELSWKDLIYSLIESEQMDPWDIDVSLIAQKFLEMLTKLKELDFRISGKMVFASAILLKMKSDILIDEDIAKFDNILNNPEENIPLEDVAPERISVDGISIFPRTPQPRKRKVSLYDLVNALEKALEVENKRKKRFVNVKKVLLTMPEKKFDLGKAMTNVYEKVEEHYKNKKSKGRILTFEDLISEGSKQDKVLTFVPLLHLDTQRKIDMEQEEHFSTIAIKLAKSLAVSHVSEAKPE
jgi:segregation and condensation protein A